jgi:branched-chain amino acid transport system permease protein
MHGLTGGSDGLPGVETWDLFGLFRFSFRGHTGFAWALGVAFLVFVAARVLVHSPFGLTLQAIRDNPVRTAALGVDNHAQLRRVFTIAAGMAGLAGGVLAQVTETVSLETLGFQRSAELAIMLILGGTGRLYGAILGAAIFLIARDQLAGMNPQYWYFWIGLLLMIVVLFLPRGLLGGLESLARRVRP